MNELAELIIAERLDTAPTDSRLGTGYTVHTGTHLRLSLRLEEAERTNERTSGRKAGKAR